MINVLDKKNVCNPCILKNEDLERDLKTILNRLGMVSMFVSWNKYRDEFIVFTGTTNLCNEFDCDCDNY